MKRIIQRCLLVLAFTGILLSHAQETTVSDVSDPTPKSSEQTSPSAPDSSFTSIETASSYSPIEKVEDGSSSRTEAAASTSDPEAGANDVTETYSRSVGSISTGKKELTDATTISNEPGRNAKPHSEAADSNEKSDSSVASTTGLPLAHSEGLMKAPLQEGEQNAAEVSSEKLSSSSDKSSGGTAKEKITEVPSAQDTSGNDSKVKHETESEAMDATTRISVATETSEAEDTTRAAASQSAEMNSIGNSSNDSGQSSVPSKDDAVSNSSDVDKNQTPEVMFSTTPSQVQTDESESWDSSKSATRKRSLNATKTAGATTVASSGLPGSSVLDTSSHTVLTSETTEFKVVESVTGSGEKQQTEMPSPNKLTNGHTDEAENNKIVSSTHGAIVTDATKSPPPINSATGNTDASAVHDVQDEHSTSEITSISPLHNTHMLPISSAALSSFSEESIHPSESIGTLAQTSGVRRDTSTISTPWRSPELELEDPVPSQHPDSSVDTASPITFDPNGMTHNFSQDPDSVTFSPVAFHVDGIPTDGYLSRLENSDSADQRPALLPDLVKYTEGTTHAIEAHGTNSGNVEEIHSSEREREGISPSSQGLLPHDEPDAEEMTSKSTVRNTEQPTVNPFFTGEPLSIHATGTPESPEVVHPLNDESEEMINDSPQFVHIQSKSTATSITDDKNDFISKELEMNVSNDISHTTGASSQHTSKAAHELDFSIDYQPEQSEIRPVTVTSPLKISESITLLPDSFNVESQAPPEVTKSGQPDTVLPDTSSPIILPNPAPSVVNQSTEAVTVILHPDVLERNVTGIAKEGENISNGSSNSTIAGIAVKTSVSVSLPLSKNSNSSVNSTSDQIMDDASIWPNISGVILPVPIYLNKDADGHPPPTAVSTESATDATTQSAGLRILKPKLKIGERDESERPRTRKPFLAPPQRSSTTVGPPVSIFKKSRTGGASITSSTTARPLPQFSTMRIHYANRMPGMVPNGEMAFSLEPMTTTVPTTTETEEPYSDEPFTELTQGPIVPSEDDVTLIKVAGCIVVDKGLRWNEQLINRHSPQYKEKANYVQMQLDRLFRTSPIASQLWKIQIDGFSGKRKTRSVVIDFFLYLIKSQNEISMEQLRSVFHDKLVNSTFSRFTVDPAKTTFEILNEEPMKPTTEAPEAEQEPVIPQWAIAVIVVGAASLIFIVLFAVVAILGRHHMRRRYSNKLNDEDSDRPSEWESKMAAAYENLAADTIYDAEDLHSDTYKKSYLVD